MERVKIMKACAAAGALMVLAGTTLGQVQRYIVTDIGVLAEGDRSYARAINNAGHVVGDSQHDATSQAFYFDGSIAALPTLAPSHAYGINDSDLIVGAAWQPEPGGPGYGGPWAYECAGPAGTVVDLHGWAHGHWVYSNAFAVNSPGNVAGDLSNGWTAHGAAWTGTMLDDLGAPNYLAQARAISDAGIIVGWAYPSGLGTPHASRMDGGTFTDLGALDPTRDSYANGINESGVIVGRSRNETSAIHAVTWGPGETAPIDLTPDDFNAEALGINESGVAVGSFSHITLGTRAAAWYGGIKYDLNSRISGDSGWTLYVASAVNDSGQIVGWGLLAGAPPYERAFLLTPACPADFNADGFVTGDDADAFADAFYWGDMAADFDGNGFVNGDDADGFGAAFYAGC